MRLHSYKVVLVLIACIVFLSSCKKKQPPIPQPQEQAPTITVPQQPPQVPPEAQPQAPTTTPPAQPPATATKPQQKTTATKPKAKPKKQVAKKPTAEKTKPVVKEGSAENTTGRLSAGIPKDEAKQQLQSAAQLRLSTETNLKNLTRTLNADQQAMVQQIRSYLQQSRTAETDGDTERAYNLAQKANVLSIELMKR